jgi:transcription initiation factor TFIID subunit 6
VDNHWALRDFSSRLIAQICKNYHTTTNNIQTRVTRLFCRSIANDKMPLASFYGALVGTQLYLYAYSKRSFNGFFFPSCVF